MNQPPPSSLDSHLGYWLRCLSNFVSRAFAARLEGQGLTVEQWVVLRTLFDCEGATLNEAAQKVGVDKSTLSRMIERLVQKRWVKREHGRDRRSLGLTLTAGGKKIVLRAARLADENDEVFFRALPAAGRERFLSTIKVLLAANGWDVSARASDHMQ